MKWIIPCLIIVFLSSIVYASTIRGNDYYVSGNSYFGTCTPDNDNTFAATTGHLCVQKSVEALGGIDD